ncbi:VanW family protein [uncultured Mobiluncus sp.]|uniref:VanW family protein n=1 Tax=uncultured Mobiluncus sp. TaxID=293425 RepID=UPI00262D161B|nr:VanW family protein [uncultured Mobiluncus sp.]
MGKPDVNKGARPGASPKGSRPAMPRPVPRPARPVGKAPGGARTTNATEMFPGFAQDKKRSGRFPVFIGAAIGVLALAYVGVAVAVSGSMPRGSSIAGVSVGGMTPDAAIKKLDSDLGDKLKQQFPVKLGAKTANIDPAVAGLQPDFTSSVHEVADFSLSPVKIIAHIGGAGALDLKSKIDEKALYKAVSAAAADLKSAPQEAGFTCQAGQLKPVKPGPGRELNLKAATALLQTSWWKQGDPLNLPGKSSAPKSTQAQLDAAIEGEAKTLMSAPVKLNVGGQSLEIPPAELCQDVSWSLRGEELKASFDGEKLKKFTLGSTKGLEKEPVNARFSFSSGSPQVVASVDGTKLDPKELADRVALGATSGENREVSVDLTPIPPQFSTDDANKAGVKEIIGEFATPLTADSVRTSNLTRAAQILTGKMYLPKQDFSLERDLGPLTPENGWRASGVFENGVHTTAIGGGLSQMCVTALNAAWFAGMDLIEFNPHGVYFTRYPAGRECTLWTGSLDLKWKNPNPTAVVLQGWTGGGQLHMRIWGTKYYTVESTQSARTNYVQPKQTINNWSKCVPSGAGQPGFTVSNTRTRYLDGKKVDSKTYTHTYAPDNAVVCAKDLAAQKASEGAAASPSTDD